jgi:8-amino-7-oxononanoate synthase
VRALAERLATGLSALRTARRERRRAIIEARDPAGTRLRIGGRDYLAFCSNDYLGLAGDPRVVAAFADAARRWGVGSGASHLVSGHSVEHHALEEEIAAFVERPRAAVFSTGYMANLGLVRALAGRRDLVLEDRLNHASLIDAGLASRARFLRYPHADVDALRGLLGSARAGLGLVATDGVFSMDGDVAPLAGIAAACEAHGATLLVDDAHGFGVLGERGRGSVEAAGLTEAQVPALMCTLGKAVGTFGAFVAGSEALVETLVQTAREYVYTTALPPAVAAATRASLRLVAAEPERRERVLRHAQRFRSAAAGLGLAVSDSASAIQPLLLGGEEAALDASEALAAAGIFVPAIRPPTVPSGTSRLRVTFSAAHGDADVDRLIESLDGLRRRGTFA